MELAVRVAPRLLPVAMLVALALSAGIAYAAITHVSRSMPGQITLRLAPIQEAADIDGDGRVGAVDLQAVARRMGTPPGLQDQVDVNRDGLVDVFDLAVVARYFGVEVPA